MNERIIKVFASVFFATTIIVSIFISIAIFSGQKISETSFIKNNFTKQAEAAEETLQLNLQSTLLNNPNLNVSNNSQLPTPNSQLRQLL